MNTKKRVYIIAFLLFAGGFFYLIFSSLNSTSVYFLNVSEALAKRGDIKNARLFGTVGSEIKKDTRGIKFPLLDKNDPSKKILIEYSGKIPDAFGVGSEVIVEGSMEHGSFKAHSLMTKCPSKYQKKS
jgi:cytochrome c-type biogenesis protein CcmE